jgi:hypothetical protein
MSCEQKIGRTIVRRLWMTRTKNTQIFVGVKTMFSVLPDENPSSVPGLRVKPLNNQA